jgi:hypothetical protein
LKGFGTVSETQDLWDAFNNIAYYSYDKGKNSYKQENVICN